MNRQHALSALLIAATLGFLVGLILLRVRLVAQNVGVYIACPDCFHTEVIRADLVMFSLVAGILLLAGVLRPAWLGRMLQLLIGLVFLIYFIDLTVLRSFSSRLFLADVALFIGEGSAVWNQFSGSLGAAWIAYAAVAAMLLVFIGLAVLPPVRSGRQRAFLLAVVAVSMGLYLVSSKQTYVHSWAIDNVFAANLVTPERERYPEAEAARVLAEADPVHKLSVAESGAAAGQRPVIVVIIESWSAWHSKLFGGYENWTPELDAAASSGLRFDNFHSIGFATVNGLVGILAGLQIWSPFLHWFEAPPFSSAWNVEPTLPQVFNAAGYHSAFLTSGPAGLYRKDEWMRNLGFAEVEGNEHPFYSELPRYAFNSATDQALYQRALQWQETATAPYLLVLETVTTHQPYADPESGQLSLELAMKYADRAFGKFLRTLRASGYFEQGILLVASDHRSMTPIPAHELELFGSTVDSRVPAFVLGREFSANSKSNRVHSQSDLLPTLQLWLNGWAELRPQQSPMFTADGSVLNASSGLECAYHIRGDQRGVLEVVCNQGQGKLLLDGTNTRFLESDGLDAELQAQILSRTARLRLEGMQRDQDWKAAEAAAQP
ncbi:MAG TPA: sulfatase-like hydrolase/transferase [Xanthomonadales bacterium]|nr:sulfatase-like hydrolase/transferase [Xanthomonadales bacterium]